MLACGKFLDAALRPTCPWLVAMDHGLAIVGFPTIEPAFYHTKLEDGDWIVVACDGLHAHVDQKQLEKEMKQAGVSACNLAHRLVQLTNDGGGSDNCTVVAIRGFIRGELGEN